MKTYNKIIFVILLVLVSCSSGSNLKLYYYPDYDLQRGKVYAFRSTEFFNQYFFVALKSKTEAGNSYLYIEMYNNEFEMLSGSKEKITNNGAEVVEFVAYVNGLAVNFGIESAMSFLWDFSTPISFIASSANEKIIIHRMFQNAFVNYVFEGVDYPAAYITQKGEGALYELVMKNFNMTDLYFAKGIGLIAFKIQNQNKKEQYVLDKRLTMNEWRILRGLN